MTDEVRQPVEPTKTVNGWKVTCLGLVILIAGMVMGAGLTAVVMRAGETEPVAGLEFVNERTMRELEHDLQLRPEQTEEIRAIFEKNLKALHEIRQEARPKIARQMNTFYAEVAEALDAEQKARWADSVGRLRNRFMRGPHERGGGRGPGPHYGPPGGRRRFPQDRPFGFWEDEPPRKGGGFRGPRREGPAPGANGQRRPRPDEPGPDVH